MRHDLSVREEAGWRCEEFAVIHAVVYSIYIFFLKCLMRKQDVTSSNFQNMICDVKKSKRL